MNTAAAVGVFWASWATSSAMVRSISWPIPVTTGTGALAMARATASLSKATRSVRAPPPRTTAITSTPARPTVPMAAAMNGGASIPCTGVSTSTTSQASPLASSSSQKSWWAALPLEVTSPIRSGATGKGTAWFLVSSASSRSFSSRRSRSASSSPSVKLGSMPDI